LFEVVVDEEMSFCRGWFLEGIPVFWLFIYASIALQLLDIFTRGNR
jgi:hypothetical protein